MPPKPPYTVAITHRCGHEENHVIYCEVDSDQSQARLKQELCHKCQLIAKLTVESITSVDHLYHCTSVICVERHPAEALSWAYKTDSPIIGTEGWYCAPCIEEFELKDCAITLAQHMDDSLLHAGQTPVCEVCLYIHHRTRSPDLRSEFITHIKPGVKCRRLLTCQECEDKGQAMRTHWAREAGKTLEDWLAHQKAECKYCGEEEGDVATEAK